MLEPPFFVLATQNPIEQEGTYPLPEAQLDRFMFLVKVGYPSFDEEMRIVEMTTKPMTAELDHVLTGPDILEIQDVVRRVPIAEHVVRYVLALVRATRVSDESAPSSTSGIAWHGTIIWYWQNGIKTGITAMSRKRSRQGFEPDGVGRTVGRLFGLHLTTAGEHVAPAG